MSSRILVLLASLLTADAALCDAQPGLNCWGNDIRNGGQTSSAAQCCALCTAQAGCAAWTWDAAEGTPPQSCWLKTSCAGAKQDSQAVSGTAGPVPPGLCIARAGVNCFHSDLSDAGVVSTTGECCAACRAYQGCKAWSWNRLGDRHCWLKADCQGLTADPDATSGAEVYPSPSPSPGPPPPPAPPPKDYHNGVSLGGWLLTEPS